MSLELLLETLGRPACLLQRLLLLLLLLRRGCRTLPGPAGGGGGLDAQQKTRWSYHWHAPLLCHSLQQQRHLSCAVLQRCSCWQLP
jgi:hypothetical protein